MTTLAAAQVSVRIGARTVLDRVSLTVGTGELVAVGGRNGAGKSTLLAVMAGLLPPGDGRVLLDGRPLSAFPPEVLARRRAVLPQRDGLQQPLLAREVVALGRYPHPGDPGPAVRRALLAVGADALADRRIDHLSGGERQRVHLARILAQVDGDGPPGVLLLDEPTSALDLPTQHHVLSLLLAATRRGMTVICVLHDLNLAACWADRIVLLAGAVLAADGAPEEVLTAPILDRVLGVRVHLLPHPDHGRPQLLVKAVL